MMLATVDGTIEVLAAGLICGRGTIRATKMAACLEETVIVEHTEMGFMSEIADVINE